MKNVRSSKNIPMIFIMYHSLRFAFAFAFAFEFAQHLLLSLQNFAVLLSLEIPIICDPNRTKKNKLLVSTERQNARAIT